MISASQQRQHLKWLAEITVIPTAAGHEGRVVRWVKQWVLARPDLAMKADAAGNLFITKERSKKGGKRGPLLITAHMDHPAFVLRAMIDSRTVELEFRGGVHDPYFRNAKIEIIDQRGKAHHAKITQLDSAAKPFKRVMAQFDRATTGLMPGDIGRWCFAGNRKLPRIEK